MPTIFDVAREASVSKSTVSRVLNGGPVSAAARRKVLRAVDRLGYRPSVSARGLVTKRTRTVGFVLTDVADPYFSEIIRGVEACLTENGYSLLLCSTRWDPRRERVAVHFLAEHRVDGLLVFSGQETSGHDELAAIASEVDRPVVLLDRTGPDLEVDSVGIDDRDAARVAVRHLINLGHRRIGHVTGPMNYHTGVRRCEGYAEALREAGVPLDERLVLPGNYTKHGGYAAGIRLLSLHDRPTAIFAANDVSALGVWQAARELGLRVPDDVALVGFDDIELLSTADIPLTTIRQPRFRMGFEGAQILLSRIEHKSPFSRRRNLTLPTELVIRESCGHRSGRQPAVERIGGMSRAE